MKDDGKRVRDGEGSQTAVAIGRRTREISMYNEQAIPDFTCPFYMFFKFRYVDYVVILD